MIDGLARTITIPELIWTFCGIVSALITMNGLKYWILLMGKYKRKGVNGRSLLQVRGHITEETILSCASLLIVASGAFQMTQPPSNPAEPVTPGGIFTAVAVIGVAVCIAIHSAVARIVWEMVRHSTMTAMERENDKHPRRRADEVGME